MGPPWAMSAKLADHTHIRAERWRRLHAMAHLMGIDMTQADIVAAVDALSDSMLSQKRANASCESCSGGTVSRTGCLADGPYVPFVRFGLCNVLHSQT